MHLDRYFSLLALFFDDFDDALDGGFKELCNLRSTAHTSFRRVIRYQRGLPIDFDASRSNVKTGIILTTPKTDKIWLHRSLEHRLCRLIEVLCHDVNIFRRIELRPVKLLYTP